MQHLDDNELLRRCTTGRSEEALSVLIHRHLDLVYSSALRQVRDPHLAKDVAQSVFLLLAKKARFLKPGTILTGWLFRSTRFLALETVRSENRRRAREHAAMEPLTDSDDAGRWREIEPLLDEAIAGLSGPDRDLILLRFFEKRSLRDLGQSFGISEAAAQKRVTRALEKLRAFLAARGGAISTATLGALLPACAVQAAPAGLAATILTAAAPVAVGTAIFSIQTLIQSITMTKLKSAAIASVLAAAVSIPVAKQHLALKETRRENQALKSTLQQIGVDPANETAPLVSPNELAHLRAQAAVAEQLRAELASLRQSSPVRAAFAEIPKDAPGPANPMERLDLGRDLMAQGKYPEALLHFLWCWDHGDENPAFTGVRVSFLLNDLRDLAEKYPPAREAMAARRDAVGEAIADQRGNVKTVYNYHQLNEHLGEPGQTMTLFDQLPSGHPARAQLIDTALDQFISNRRYTDVIQSGNPEASFDNARFLYKRIMDREVDELQAAIFRRRAVNYGANALEALAGAGQVSRAIALADSILALDPTPETRGQLLKHAERSGSSQMIAYIQNVPIDSTATAVNNRY